ncbi:cyclopropane fatty acyl phospholipid synthase [Shewanella surugensis]|uniref:Cyclopropane fatty acyl phospholipid synthase n=1 Tax=Shewanella surugensis TaxID=212020 RepID=A0ABT0LDC4_9GAMM|nr:cyclopropane fatty acyl phospholipid synthase [Shewanella surugensis]MCL1125684.1 cyclopropane fatty acyl phospholipid synthase [Shewanella surugensis]
MLNLKEPDFPSSEQVVVNQRHLAAKTLFESLIKPSGIRVNGNQPYDIQVKNPKFYHRVIHQGNLGLGEAYMEGWWECERIDLFIEKLLQAKLERHVKNRLSLLWPLFITRYINLQTAIRAFAVAKQHYNIGNDLFEKMLDESMAYSCAYWQQAETLQQAQDAKMNLLCRKLKLEPGMKLLDIGCGWGGLAAYAAEHFSVSVTAITISNAQFEYAVEKYKHLDICFKLQDYRDLNEHYDRIVSVGMLEHVGHKNYRRFMKKVDDCLAPQGLAVLHTIVDNTSNTTCNPWINKYIFVNGVVPSVAQLSKAAEGLFVIEDIHNFGPDYAKTLMAWHDNFIASYPTLNATYDKRFYRMWRYYLLSCAGGFKARYMQLMQLVMSKNRADCYQSER